MQFEALHYTAASSQTVRKAKNFQPADLEGLLARCDTSEWGRGEGGSSRGSLARQKHIAPMRGRCHPALAVPFARDPPRFWGVCSPSHSSLRKTCGVVQGNHGVNSSKKVRSRSPGPGLPEGIGKVGMGPPPPFSNNELLICLRHFLWNNSPQSISAQH